MVLEKAHTSRKTRRTGKVTDSGTYRQGKYHGVRRHLGTDGVIQQEYAYEDGKLVGAQSHSKTACSSGFT